MSGSDLGPRILSKSVLTFTEVQIVHIVGTSWLFQGNSSVENHGFWLAEIMLVAQRSESVSRLK